MKLKGLGPLQADPNHRLQGGRPGRPRGARGWSLRAVRGPEAAALLQPLLRPRAGPPGSARSPGGTSVVTTGRQLRTQRESRGQRRTRAPHGAGDAPPAEPVAAALAHGGRFRTQSRSSTPGSPSGCGGARPEPCRQPGPGPGLRLCPAALGDGRHPSHREHGREPRSLRSKEFPGTQTSRFF